MKLPKFTDDHLHTIIGGESGAGKTHMTNWVHTVDHSRISIFFNSAHVSDIGGVEVQSVDQLAAYLKEGYRKFNFMPPIGADEDEVYERLSYFLMRLGKSGTYLRLITDEIHEFASHKDDPAGILWRKGRNYNIKNIGITQEYRTVCHSVLTQSKWHCWIGRPNTFEGNYFDRYNIPKDALKNLGDHQYAVMRGGSIVQTGSAPENY